MTELFKRAARVVIDTIELVVDPNDPGSSLDVQFVIGRSLKPEPNTAEIQVYNLNPDHRSQLEELDRVACTVEAGYQDRTALLFSGTLRTTTTTREGPSLVTALSSGDGEKEYKQSRVNLSIAKGSPNASIVSQIVKSMKIKEGNLPTASAALASAPLLLPAGGVLSGAASQIMTRVAQSLGFEWSIQEGALQLLQIGNPITAGAVLLSPDTGLIGSPSIDNKGILTAQSLLIPDVFPGRILVLQSERLSGNYRVEGCNYSGSTFGPEWSIDIEAKKL